MKAAVAPKERSPWEVRDVPDPVPGVNQVLIKIHASGLCYTDIHMTNGALGIKFPHRLGHEPAGDIVAIGEGVTTRKVGDRVGVPWRQKSCGRCEWCLRGKPQFCPNSVNTGIEMEGSHAEYMLAYADATMLLPEGLSYEQAAPIFCAGFTVYSGLKIAKPAPHERVAVVGVGGLGHLGVQYSKAAGFETIAVTHSKDKEKMIRQMGADEVVNDGAELQRAGGADVILATSNSYKATAEALQGLRPDGRFVLMGVSQEPFPIPVSFIFKRGRLIGSSQNDPEDLYEALDYVAKGKVKVWEEIYPLSDIARAYDRVSKGEVRFRAVITP